jgi:two-component sensor histidine kinase
VLRRPGKSLALRLTVWFLLLSFLPLGVMAIFVRHRVVDTFMTLTARQQLHHARSLAAQLPVVDRLDTDRDVARQALLDASKGLDGIAAVVDAQGYYHLHSDAEKRGTSAHRDFSPAMVAAMLSGGEGTLIDPEADRILGYAGVEGQPWVAIAVTEGEDAAGVLDRLERVSFVQLAVSMVLVSIAGGVIIWIIVGEPIQTLNEAARQLGDGQLDVAIAPEDMTDELRLLAITFNQMARQLRQLVGDLEEKVAALQAAEKRALDALKDKEVLLRELFHRTKNNMQVISSMLNLQSMNLQDEVGPLPAKVEQAFRETENRIHVMALVHDKLYQTQNLSRLNLAEYIRDLTRLLLQSYAPPSQHIDLTMDVERVAVLIDVALPCGLVFHELFSNALKYAFAGRSGGEIRIGLRREADGRIHLQVADRGVGLPEDLDPRHAGTFGLEVMYGIVERQLQGEVTVSTAEGTTWDVWFSDDRYGERV